MSRELRGNTTITHGIRTNATITHEAITHTTRTHSCQAMDHGLVPLFFDSHG